MKSIINNIFFACLGLLMILYYIYFNLIITKLPKDLNIQTENLTKIIYCSIFITFVSLTIINLYVSFKIIYDLKENNIIIAHIKYYFNDVIQLFYKSLKAIDDIIKHKLLAKHTGKILKKFGLPLNQFLMYNVSKRYLLIFICCFIIPKILILFIFTIDILYFHKFWYIYQFAWLLIIPLLYRYILFTYKEFAEYNIHQMLQNVLIFRFTDKSIMNTQEVITFTTDEQYQTKKYTAMPVELSEELTQMCYNSGGDVTLTLMYYLPQFNTFTKLRKTVTILEQLQSKYNIYFNCIRFFIYSFIWLYIIIYTRSVTKETLTILANLILNIANVEEPFSGISLF